MSVAEHLRASAPQADTATQESTMVIEVLGPGCLLRPRFWVFVAEQACAYEDLDGRDADSTPELPQAADGPGVLSAVPVLRDPDAMRIGRVASESRRPVCRVWSRSS